MEKRNSFGFFMLFMCFMVLFSIQVKSKIPSGFQTASVAAVAAAVSPAAATVLLALPLLQLLLLQLPLQLPMLQLSP